MTDTNNTIRSDTNSIINPEEMSQNIAVVEQNQPLPVASSENNRNSTRIIQRGSSDEAAAHMNNNNNNNSSSNNNNNNINNDNNSNVDDLVEQVQAETLDFSIPSSPKNGNHNNNNNNSNNSDMAVVNDATQQQLSSNNITSEHNNNNNDDDDTNNSQARQPGPASSINISTVVDNNNSNNDNNNDTGNNLQSDLKNVKQDIETLMQEKFDALFLLKGKKDEIVDAFKAAMEEFPQIFEQTTDEYGRSALHLAILSKNGNLAKWLVDEGGARENAVDSENQSIAHYAAYMGDPNLLSYLVDEARCSINMKDKTGRSLICHAAMRNNWQIIELLVNKYDIDINSTDHFNATALHWAASKGAEAAGAYLVQRGINIHRKVNEETATDMLHKRKDENTNFLHFWRFLVYYKERGEAFMNLVRNKKTTVKELKEKWKEWNDLAKSMSKIVSLEKDTIKLEYYRNSLGQTALHIAAYKSNLEVVKFLVQNNFHITAVDYLQRLPVHYASLYGKEDIATYLINRPPSEDEKQVRRRKSVGEDDDANVQVVKHWKKKTSTGLTPDQMALKGLDANLHTNKTLNETLLNYAKVRGQRPQEEQNDVHTDTSIEQNTLPRISSEKALEEAIEKDKMLIDGPPVAANNMEDLVGKGASIILDRVNLPQYLEKFNEDGFDTIESLKNLNEIDLKEMGVKKGHIRVILNYLHEEYPTNANDGNQVSLDNFKANAVANLAPEDHPASTVMGVGQKNVLRKKIHRANTSPNLSTRDVNRKSIDPELAVDLHKRLVSEPPAKKESHHTTTSMVITKGENKSLQLNNTLRGSPKDRIVYITDEELSFKNSTPSNFGHKSKTATWKTMDVVVKYVEEACLEGCREIFRLINLDESRHPNVLPFLGIVPHPSSVVVNFMDSGSFRDHLYLTNKKKASRKLKPIEWADAVNWLSQAANGIRFLHDKGVIHGGVATHSFMMQSVDDGKYVLKVSDMGLHRPVKDVELAGRKLHWDAPEVVVESDDDKEFTTYTDAYGFGMCVYEVLHRVQPWKMVKNIDVLKKLANKERPDINVLVSEDAPGFNGVKALLEKCWLDDPVERCTFEKINGVLDYSLSLCNESEVNVIIPVPSKDGGESNSSSGSEDENQNSNAISTSASTTPEKLEEVKTPVKEENAEKDETIQTALSPLDAVKAPARSAFDLLAPPSGDEDEDDDANDEEDKKDMEIKTTAGFLDSVADTFVSSPKMDSPEKPETNENEMNGELEEIDMGPSQAHNSVFDLLAPPPGSDDDDE